MPTIRPTRFLRLALLGDALASGAAGFLAFAGAGLLAEPLGLPAPLLRWAGVALLPYAAVVALLGTREGFPRAAVWAVVIANALWAAASFALLAGGVVSPTVLGVAFVAFQAAAVAGFATAQAYGMRSDAVGRPLHA